MSKDQTRRLRRRKPGDMRQLRAVLWGVLLEVEGIATDEHADAADKLKAAHALASLSGSYTKVHETVDLEERLAALREEVRELKVAHAQRPRAA